MTQLSLVLEGARGSLSTPGRGARPLPGSVILVEDNAGRSQRRVLAGVAFRRSRPEVTIRVHRIRGAEAVVIAQKSYPAGQLPNGARQGGRSAVALELLDNLRLRRKRSVVVAGPTYGSNPCFVSGVLARGFAFAVEVRPAARFLVVAATGRRTAPARTLLARAHWKKLTAIVPGASRRVVYAAADLLDVSLPTGVIGRLFAVETGGIDGVHRGTIFGLTSLRRVSLRRLLVSVGWARWIRPAVRRQERLSLEAEENCVVDSCASGFRRSTQKITVRANIALARRQDQTAEWNQTELSSNGWRSQGVFASLSQVNVVELFAGAGGMGLGFLLAAGRRSRYRLVCSAEVDPIYVATLKQNHRFIASLKHQADVVPAEIGPVDLRAPETLFLIKARVKQAGGVHLLIGGPPCQGFSNANRNSWHSRNPHNELINVFLRYVEVLRPPMFLLENVQGILWTSKDGRSSARLTVGEHLAQRMSSLGYEVFPKLLDGVWYGAPQYRSRFFLLGLRRDLGYRRDDFGQWGPFPLPTHGPGCPQSYVTVRQAIGDLPPVKNGHDLEELDYHEPASNELRSNRFLSFVRTGASRGVIFDHVTSRHAEYVIDRYRRIPQGGNWQDIAEELTNYANVERTHSNIYRRLKWNEPSITIGHYRKSMLVHPSQQRGLSLREASRLQSFPDWFRFAGSPNGSEGGLVHKQQQLGNAVCPLVAKAVAGFLLGL